MNSDATEAALGLLGLSPLNASSQSHPQPQPQPQHHVADVHGPSLTSTSVGIAIDQSIAPHIQSIVPPSLVPLKRKQPSPAATPLAPSNLGDSLSTKPRQPPYTPVSSSTPPIKPNHSLQNASTKSSTAPSQRHPPQRLFSPILTTSVPPQTPPTSQLPLASPSTSHQPLALSDVPPPDSDAISCICGFTYDDGFSIACDDCSRWCHAACFGIVQGGEVPEFWKCWVCDPTVEVDKERAVKIQKGRLKTMRMKASQGTNGGTPVAAAASGSGPNSAVDEGSSGTGKPVSRRKASPGAERKSRRGSAVAAAIEGSGSSRKKRRASMLSPADPSSPSILSSNHSSTQPHTGNSRISNPNGNGQAASSSLPPTPVTFPPDLYPNPSVYAQLLRVAKAWRGVTALNPPSPLIHPPPKTYNERGYTRVDSQGYRDRYGYSMSPLDNAMPVILDESTDETYVPRTVLRTDPPMSCSFPPTSTTCTPAHLRPPSPRLHVASDPSPFPNTSIYPSPPTSHYMSPSVPCSSHPPSYTKSPLTPSTNTISSSNPNNTIPATTLLAPYTSSIVPSAAYLADPLNGYAHLGMGKPQVRLVGGGWGAGLDARGIGGDSDLSDSGEKGNKINADVADGKKAKWARCGCWPNAVVRPVICGGTKGGKGKRKGTRHKAECVKAAPDGPAGGSPGTVSGRCTPTPTSRTPEHQTHDSYQDDPPVASDSETDSMSLSFALFALRDLRADEEIVLGWEWDDGHAVHMLPALMESPGLFAPGHLHHLRAQFTSILHALSSTFTTCACGSSTRDCAVRVMESVVEGRWPWPGGDMTSEGSEGDSSDMNGASEGLDDGDVDVEGESPLDPHPSRKLGLGMNMDVDIDIASIEVDDKRVQQVKKHKVRKRGKVEDAAIVERGKDENATESVSNLKSKVKKTIDLGPLVGVKRGFRTREKMPMNGGWGGVEIVPSSLKTFPPVSEEEDLHVGGKGKEKARVADGKDDDMDIDPSPSTLPPRMRKAWSRPAGDQPEASQGNSNSNHAENWRTHERWRSPPDLTVDSPTSAGSMEGRDGHKQNSVGMDGDGEEAADEQETEFDTETEVDGSDDTRQMPPPPMPASLDPTTISSLAHAHAVRSLSPRDSVQWDKNSVSATRIPPRSPTPTSAPLGRASQPPSQGTSTATPVPSIPPEGDSSAPSPAPSLPPAQAQVRSTQSHPTPPVPSVSPSAPFSQLSLHSPDASSSPHLSALFVPTEPTLPSSASASKHASDCRVSSPPLHKPSKPLHVHPQNESPAFPASLAAPVVMPSSPDGMRDTPAEAQYQQSYRSSPESPREAHPSSDTEKRHPSNGEVYRVRFASPEVLSGLPRLKGKTASDRSESLDADEEVPADSSPNSVNERDAGPPDHDAMDVDVDVVGDGDGQRVDNAGPSHAASPENKTDLEPIPQEDECPSLPIPGSPCPLSPTESLPQNTSITDGADPENELLSSSTDPHETTPQGEPLASEHEPAQPQPKVKMSLKDFALRRKKQREEELAAKTLRSPVTSEGPGLPPSPNVDVKRDLASEHTGAEQTADSGYIINGHGVQINDVTMEDVVDSSGSVHVDANGLDGGAGHGHDGRMEVKATTEDEKLSAETQAPSAIAVAKASDTTQPHPQPARSPTSPSRVLGERNNTDMHLYGKPPTTLTAKIEIMEAVVPSGLVGADDRTPDVVSFAPEPPPPPSTTKQTGDLMIADDILPAGSLRRSVPPSTPSSASPTSMSASTSTSAGNSRSNSVGISTSTSHPPPQPQVSTPSSSMPSSRRPSHEDGEITSSLPSKSYLPQSHTPPTQPRSFHAVHPPSPNAGSTSSTVTTPRRPPPPLSRSPLSNGNGPPVTPISSRPLPSGPRALRGSMSQPTHPPSYSSSRPPYTGSQYIPRGPSADRDRIDWERSDRQWAQVRSRGRAGSNGWGR